LFLLPYFPHALTHYFYYKLIFKLLLIFSCKLIIYIVFILFFIFNPQMTNSANLGQNWATFWEIFFGGTFFHGKKFCIGFDKKWVGIDFGRVFLTNSSGPNPTKQDFPNLHRFVRFSYKYVDNFLQFCGKFLTILWKISYNFVKNLQVTNICKQICVNKCYFW
jgi:hypothetical protein